jgi:hypothetical protein
MPRRVYLLIGAICALAALVLAGTLVLPSRPVEWAWWGAAFLLFSVVLGERGAVEITRESDQASYVVSVATIPHLAAAILLPPWVAMALAGTGMLADEVRKRSPWLRLVFNVACTTSSVGLAALEANLLGVSGDRLGNGDWAQVPALFAVAATYYAANTLPVGGIGALVGGGSFLRIVAQNARFTAPAEFSLAVIGGLAGFIWVKDPHWLLAGLFPGAISQLTLRYIAARNRKAVHFSALDQLGRQLSLGLSVEEVFRSTSEHLSRVRSVDGCFLIVDDVPLRLTGGLAADPACAAHLAQVAARVRESGARVWIEDARTDRVLQTDAPPPARSWLVLPLADTSGPVGCFGMLGEDARAFSDDDLEFFTLVGERVGLALEGVRRAAELVRMAYHDILTGLPNRALLLDRLEQQLVRRDPRQPAAVLLLDLDNF